MVWFDFGFNFQTEPDFVVRGVDRPCEEVCEGMAHCGLPLIGSFVVMILA